MSGPKLILVSFAVTLVPQFACAPDIPSKQLNKMMMRFVIEWVSIVTISTKVSIE
jgi:hypothetical protein